MRVVIVGGGTPPDRKLLECYIDKETIIVAADGGADILNTYGIVPDYLLGDFDSISEEAYQNLENNSSVTRFPREKDFTDTHIAYERARNLGADEIILLGCTGKRIDHFMANLCVLYKGLKEGIKVILADDYNVMFMTDKSIKLEGEPQQVFSLFSYGEDTEELTLRGVKYPLTRYYLSVTDNLTVSNEFVENYADIDFKKGCLLVMLNT